MAKVGRPRMSEKFRGQISAAEHLIADNLPNVVGKLLELSEGIWFEEEDAKGTRRVYKRAPDIQACKYLVDRIMGKPTERVEADQDGQLVIRLKYPDQIEARSRDEDESGSGPE